MNFGPEDEDDFVDGPDDEAESSEADAGGDDGLDPDEDLGDDGQAEGGQGDEPAGRKDPLGSDEGTPRQGPVEVRQPSRAERRFQELSRRAKEAEEKAARYEREAQEARFIRERNQGPDLQAQIAQRRREELERLREEARISQDPTAYLDAQRRHDREDFDARIGALQAQQIDSGDRAAFDRMCDRNPAVAAIRDKVEAEIANLRRQGGNAGREAVAYYLLGQAAVQRAGAAKTRQSKRAANGIEREAARPVRSRSDLPSGGRRESRGGDERAARAKRLEDVQI